MKLFRLDRFLSLYVLRPVTRRLGNGDGLRIPILMYHSISDDPEPKVHPYYRICTPPDRFREQMKFLHENGYHVISLSEALEFLCGGEYRAQSIESFENREVRHEAHGTKYSISECNSEILVSHIAFSRPHAFRSRGLPSLSPRGPFVVLTFDDGYRDFYTNAWPILSEFGFKATVFLPTAFIDENFRSFNVRSSRLPFSRVAALPALGSLALPPLRHLGTKTRPCLSWPEVKELHRKGVSFGSHTVSHVRLDRLDLPALRQELFESKKKLEDQLGGVAGEFSYPYAYPEADRGYCSLLSSTLKEAGYTCCVTTRIGRASRNDDPYTLRRIPVNGADDLALFSAKLQGSYDWMALAQRLVKSFK